MPSAQGASFAGLPLRGLSFPFSRGVSPSIFTLYLPFQANIDAVGDLSLSNGLIFRNCAVAGSFVRHSYDGKWPTIAVHGCDRRWAWAGKTISGDYNRRAADGTLDPTTIKSPGELAGLLLQALGEAGDTTRMPAQIWPRAKWNNTSAALALQQLCDYVACEVVLNPSTDRVEIWPLGQGQTTPTGQQELIPKAFHAPRAYVPSQILAVGGESVFQHRLQLKCVLRDYTTGNQKLMANWESKPSDWTVESPFSLPGVSSTNSRAIAFEALYREFRVQGQQDGTLAVPNCSETIGSTDQYLLNNYLLETETDLGSFKRNLPCYLDGDYWAYTDLPNNTSGVRYTGRFDLDPDRRIVKLPFPLFKLSSSGAYNEPNLYLTTSYRVKSTTGQVVRLQRQGAVGGTGGTLVLKRPECFAIYSSSTSPNAQTNTEATVQQELDKYVSLFQQKYANPLASEITYPGLQSVSLDGNVAQVTWKWFLNGNANGATTCVCEGEELDSAAVDKRERRRREVLAQIAEAVL